MLLVVLHFEEAGHPALKPNIGKVGRLLIRVCLLLDLYPVLAGLRVADQAIGNVAERLVDGLLVLQFGFVALRRDVFLALVQGASVDELCVRLDTNRNAVYQVMFAARRKIRAALVADGLIGNAAAIPA